MSEKTIVVIEIEGGVIQAVQTNLGNPMKELDVVVIDYDVDDVALTVSVPDCDGNPRQAVVGSEFVHASPQFAELAVSLANSEHK